MNLPRWWQKRRDRSRLQWAAHTAWQVGELNRVPARSMTWGQMQIEFPFLCAFERMHREYVTKYGEQP